MKDSKLIFIIINHYFLPTESKMILLRYYPLLGKILLVAFFLVSSVRSSNYVEDETLEESDLFKRLQKYQVSHMI